MVRPPKSGSETNADAVIGISEDVVRDGLRCILASVDFDVPERVRRFLTYVVEESLAGRAGGIKAYTIAVEVFGREADFDVMNDPVVRIEAGRLRRGLERYYLLEGRTAALVIGIAKGGYVPSFRWQENGQSNPEPLSTSILQRSMNERLKSYWLVGTVGSLMVGIFVAVIAMVALRPPVLPTGPALPSLLVKPFVNLTGKAEAQIFAEELDDEILTQLASKDEIMIYRSEAPAAFALSTSAAAVPSQSRRHLLEGTIRASDGKLRITSRLLDSETTAIIWSGIYEADLRERHGFDMETDLATKIVSDVRLRLRPGIR